MAAKDPACAHKVDEWLRKFQGKEDLLLKDFEAKYDKD